MSQEQIDEQAAKDKLEREAKIGYQLGLADLLLRNGGSLSQKDSQKQTPFSVCFDHDNIELLQKLLSGVSLNKEPSLLHAFNSKILDVRYQSILKQLLDNGASAATMNSLDGRGMSPLLAYIE